MKPASWMLCALSLISTATLASTPDTEAVEFYKSGTHGFFVTASASEAATLDASSATWLRTGRSFQVWADAASAPAGAQAVCRF